MCVRFPYVVMVALQEYQLEYAQRGADGRFRKVFYIHAYKQQYNYYAFRFHEI